MPFASAVLSTTRGKTTFWAEPTAPNLEPVSTERNRSGRVAVLKLGIDGGRGISIPIGDSRNVTIVLLADGTFRSAETLLKANTGEISC